MRNGSTVFLIAGIAITAIAMVALVAAPEVAYQYNRNGHSLNPATYAAAAFSKVRLTHPFWHGRWSARHT